MTNEQATLPPTVATITGASVVGDRRAVVFLLNRTAGSGFRFGRVEQLVQLLTRRGYCCHLVRDVENLAEIALKLHADGELRAVIACGGDGTLAEALNRLDEGVPIAVLPMGTENLLARYMRYTTDPERVANLLDQGVVVRLDAGRAGGRLFTLVLSAGFDAQVIHEVHAKRTGRITHFAYFLPIVRALWSYGFPKVRATATFDTGECATLEGSWAFAANLPVYAQKLPIVHPARGNDGLLDLCMFRRGSVASGIWYFWHVLRQRHHRLPSVDMHRFRHLRIESLGTDDIPYQIDGDPGGVLPVDIEVIPRRLSLLVSPEVAERHGLDSELPVDSPA